MTVDLGWGEKVIGPDMIQYVPITESDKKGTTYEVANGETIENK